MSKIKPTNMTTHCGETGLLLQGSGGPAYEKLPKSFAAPPLVLCRRCFRRRLGPPASHCDRCWRLMACLRVLQLSEPFLHSQLSWLSSGCGDAAGNTPPPERLWALLMLQEARRWNVRLSLGSFSLSWNKWARGPETALWLFCFLFPSTGSCCCAILRDWRLAAVTPDRQV